MNNTTPTKEHQEYLTQRLAEILPEIFRLHLRLMEIADPATKEINDSLNDIADKLNYNNYVMFSFLSSLAELKFIKFLSPSNFHQKVKIKIIIY
jgi:hypothetical protein